MPDDAFEPIDIDLGKKSIDALNNFGRSIEKLSRMGIAKGGSDKSVLPIIQELKKIRRKLDDMGNHMSALTFGQGANTGSGKTNGENKKNNGLIGGITKSLGLGQLSFLTKIGGAGLVLGALKSMVDSSPQLQVLTKMFSTSIKLFLMPIGNMIGRIFMPLGIMLLKASAKWMQMSDADIVGQLLKWASPPLSIISDLIKLGGGVSNEPTSDNLLPLAGAELMPETPTSNAGGFVVGGQEYWGHVSDVVESLGDGEEDMESLANIFKLMVDESGQPMEHDLSMIAHYFSQGVLFGKDAQQALMDTADVLGYAYEELVAKIKRWMQSAAKAAMAAERRGSSNSEARRDKKAAMEFLSVLTPGTSLRGAEIAGKYKIDEAIKTGIEKKKQERIDSVKHDYSSTAWQGAISRVGEDALMREAKKASAIYGSYANPLFATGGKAPTSTPSAGNSASNKLWELTGGAMGTKPATSSQPSMMQKLRDSLETGVNQSYATGGVITEPILGIGRSGTSYLLGENGNEMVTPLNKISRGDVNITINIARVERTADLEQFKPLIQRWILEANSRRGII